MPTPWPSRFDAAARDELRHARLCATVGASLGSAKPVYDARPVRARLAALPDERTRVAVLLVVEVAIGETISMCLFRAGCRSAVEPITRAALSAILHDEARHQRLGWMGLRVLLPTLTASQRAAVEREAALGLGACERNIAVPAMRWLDEGHPFDPAYAALGVLKPEARLDAFYFAVERLAVPRLGRVGLDGALAWKNRYRVSRRD
jgi:hypothetical protein